MGEGYNRWRPWGDWYRPSVRESRFVIPRSRKEEPTVLRDNPNWHRFPDACPFYRERWAAEGEDEDGLELLYQVICLQNTPPETHDEQDRCMDARTICWRLKARRRARSA